MPPIHIANYIKGKLPTEKKEASWEALAQEFPWYPMVHWLQAAENPADKPSLEKAALYSNDALRLHGWLHAYKEVYPIQEVELQSAMDAAALAPIEWEEPALPPQEDLLIDEEAVFVHAKTETEQDFGEAEPEESLPPELEAEKTDAIVDHLHEVALAESETVQDLSDLAPLTPEQQAIAAEEEDYPEEEDTTPQAEVPELPALQMSGLSKIMNTPASETDLLSPIEPYHTVDYFASQGIKVEKNLRPETATQLDNQVKSFTEWLKSMKKLSYQPATAYTDPLVEKKAKSSLQKEEVVTEAMAEVWVKQLHWEEAIQVYNKLMLLHPEKSHYFAARIKDIKAKQ